MLKKNLEKNEAPFYRRGLVSVRNFILFFVLSSVIVTVLCRFINPPVTPLMIIRKFEMKDRKPSKAISRQWVPLERISPDVVLAFIVSEDPAFIEHRGFEFDAIKKAIEYNSGNSGIIGASTITQQTAKNLFLWPGRSWLRKGLEAYFTVLLELFWPKGRIIEVYCNIIETGDGLFGIEAASRAYYKKAALYLNAEESARIAAVLPNPGTWRPDGDDLRVYKRYRWIYWHMTQRERVSFD